MKFFFFVLKFATVLCAAHYLLYVSTIKFFSISDPSVRKIFFGCIFFLSIGFLPSAVLLRLYPTGITRFFYIFSAIWLGLFIYLLLAASLSWMLFFIGKLFFTSAPNMRLISIFLFTVATVVSGHGIWRAQNPEIKPISVTIKNLPPAWQNKTIVQLSDVHLGTLNRTRFMQRVADKVNHLKPDLILITGDLFDGMGGELNKFISSLNSLQASKGVYFVTGNHEGYLDLLTPLSILRQTHIRVLNNEVVDIDGLQIVGISYPDYRLQNHTGKLLSTSGTYDPQKPSILMYHTPTNIAESNPDRASQQAKAYWRPDTSMSFAKQMGIDLQLSGHTHRGQLFPFGFLTRKIYNGYDYGLHRDGDFQIYVTSGTGTWGPPMRVGTPAEIVLITLGATPSP